MAERDRKIVYSGRTAEEILDVDMVRISPHVLMRLMQRGEEPSLLAAAESARGRLRLSKEVIYNPNVFVQNFRNGRKRILQFHEEGDDLSLFHLCKISKRSSSGLWFTTVSEGSLNNLYKNDCDR